MTHQAVIEARTTSRIRSRLGGALGLLVAAAAGFLVARLAVDSRGTEAARTLEAIAVEPMQPPRPSEPLNERSGGIDRLALRAEVARAVGEALAERDRAASQAQTAPPLSSDNVAAFDRATDLVDAALAAKRWTEHDKAEMRPHRAMLTGEQRVELQRRIAAAINNRRLSMELRGPPF